MDDLRRARVAACFDCPSLEIMGYLRDLSCRDLCSDLLNARLQNWHLYRFSFSLSVDAGALRALAGDTGSEPATADMAARAVCWSVVGAVLVPPASGGAWLMLRESARMVGWVLHYGRQAHRGFASGRCQEGKRATQP